MLMMDTTQTPVRINAAATIATMTELLRTFVFLCVEPVGLPIAEQDVSKGGPQSRGLCKNAGGPKRWMVKGMVPERLLEETLK